MVSRISYLLWFTALAIAAYLFIHFTREDSGPRPAYIGSVRCQPCHESQRVGDQYGIWLHSDHSRAYSALGSDSAREYLARTGSTLDSCVSCHATLGRIGVNEAEQAIDSEGVGCERCHGPGSEYAFFNIMRDRNDFTSHGGVVGSLDDCYGCHARDIGSDERRCPFQTTNFDADSEWAIIGHPTPTSDSATQTTNND